MSDTLAAALTQAQDWLRHAQVTSDITTEAYDVIEALTAAVSGGVPIARPRSDTLAALVKQWRERESTFAIWKFAADELEEALAAIVAQPETALTELIAQVRQVIDSGDFHMTDDTDRHLRGAVEDAESALRSGVEAEALVPQSETEKE